MFMYGHDMGRHDHELRLHEHLSSTPWAIRWMKKKLIGKNFTK